MNTKLLRQQILDLAIRGKLVKQDPNDEPASVLLERIRAEKEQLIQQGKIKKTKAPATTDTPHYQNTPFDIPNSWQWARLGEITLNRDAERVPLSSAVRKKQTNKRYNYYGASGVIDKVDNYLFEDRLLLVGEDGANLLSRSKDNAFFAEGRYWVNNHAHVIDSTDKLILDYVAIVINSTPLDKYITGSAQPKFTQDNLNNFPIPLPPLAEQRRIVAEVEKWFALIDDLETNKQDLQSAVKQVRAKVLDLAIHGKLVSQDPNDESAIDLLRRINPHYTPSDTSHYQNIPFDIPTSWQWVQLGIVFQLINGDRGNNYPSKEKLQELGAHPFISAINIKDGSISKDGLLYVTQEQYDALGSGKLKLNDIVLCIRGSLGKSAIYPFDSGAIASSLVILRNSKNVADTEFVFDYIHSPLFSANVERNNNGTAQPNLSAKSVAGFLFPLPPLAEQRRIISEIERIFGVLDTIEENIR